jgi:hypothetical protein
VDLELDFDLCKIVRLRAFWKIIVEKSIEGSRPPNWWRSRERVRITILLGRVGLR